MAGCWLREQPPMTLADTGEMWILDTLETALWLEALRTLWSGWPPRLYHVAAMIERDRYRARAHS